MEEQCGPLTFFSNFDSGNLSRVEKVEAECVENTPSQRNKEPNGIVNLVCDYEYNVWTCPDCMGTQFENGNRTWFYFGIRGGRGGKTIKINVMNMNKQGKLYSQGMAPVVKVVPSREQKWERIRNRTSHKVVDGQFILTFSYTFPEIKNATVYFAFCYPYTYKECQKKLAQLDKEYLTECQDSSENRKSDSDIFYHRELLCHSLDQLRVDLVTVSSYLGMQDEREDDIPGLFPEIDGRRANKFNDKKVIFMSARVHPGETPSSFVFNGFLDFILRRNDPRAALLRDKFVFKLIPMLNPDGVVRGYYRTDTRGVNLNRVYLNPDSIWHPSIFAVKCLISYYHTNGGVSGGSDLESTVKDEKVGDCKYATALQVSNSENQVNINVNSDLEEICTTVKELKNENSTTTVDELKQLPETKEIADAKAGKSTENTVVPSETKSPDTIARESAISDKNECNESGLALYVDLHGHASKRGCFIYANNFENENDQINCLLFPKLMSINSPNFDFNACNFSLKNMLSKDKRDGMSKEGSGRVAILKSTGILHSYTLECNYNTGRITNTVPSAFGDNGRATPPIQASYPPKYTPEIYAEVGRALAISVLDLFEINPWSRILSSEFHTIRNIKAWLLTYVQQTKEILASKKASNSKNSSNSNATLLPLTRPRGGSESSCKLVNMKHGATSKTNITRSERNGLRKTSKCKIELVKPCQTFPGVDEKAIPTAVKITKLQTKCAPRVEDKSKENAEAGKELHVNSEESLQQKRQAKKPLPQTVGSKSRSQISKVTLSLESSKKLRSKKTISEEVEKRVQAYRKKSTNELTRNCRKRQSAPEVLSNKSQER